MNTNTELLRTAALKRADANFAPAPRSSMIKVVTWLSCVIVPAVVIAPIVMSASHSKLASLPSGSMRTLVFATMSLGALIALIGLVAGWFCSRITSLKLSGQTLSINLTFWSARFDLAGLRSVDVDAKALKGTLRTFGNGGLGAYHGYFYSKRMGKFRAYVTDTSRAVVLRWENKCVVVSPGDTEYFIEEVCKRTGARKQN